MTRRSTGLPRRGLSKPTHARRGTAWTLRRCCWSCVWATPGHRRLRDTVVLAPSELTGPDCTELLQVRGATPSMSGRPLQVFAGVASDTTPSSSSSDLDRVVIMASNTAVVSADRLVQTVGPALMQVTSCRPRSDRPEVSIPPSDDVGGIAGVETDEPPPFCSSRPAHVAAILLTPPVAARKSPRPSPKAV